LQRLFTSLFLLRLPIELTPLFSPTLDIGLECYFFLAKPRLLPHEQQRISFLGRKFFLIKLAL